MGFCGGFRPHKGASVLLAAVSLVRERFPECRFSLYGCGGVRSELEQRVRAAGLEGAGFHDFVPHDRLPAVMADFDVYVVPAANLAEVYGVVGLEAQAMEVPVVASRISGLPDTVLDGRTGLLVEPGSPADLARGICALLADEQQRRAMGRAGREWVRRAHNWPVCLDQMISVYERVMQGAPRRQFCAAPATT